LREFFEEQELTQLSPLATKSKFSNGRQHAEPTSPTRTCFQRDRDRIVHSKAFRRLKHKTQVFVATESDHFRSRLTHTIEVAQISRHLSRLLRLNEDLSEAIALSHDLGHTPFGHAGERTLNLLMKDHGGFEHNLQSLRIVDTLEKKYPQFDGLNLSFEVREGLRKHSTPWDHPEGESHHVSLEAQLVNLADEIAYNNHDLDDGLSAGILRGDALMDSVVLWKEAKEMARKKYTNISDGDLKYVINSHLISSQIQDVVQTAERNIHHSGIDSTDALQSYQGPPLIEFSKEMREKADALRTYLMTHFYTHHSIYRMNKKGQSIIDALFNAFIEDTNLLPKNRPGYVLWYFLVRRSQIGHQLRL